MAGQREGLLKLLPPEERALRRRIFKLEDEAARMHSESSLQRTEGAQVDKLLSETVKRNVELVDAVATLQGQVDKLRRAAAGKKVARRRGQARKLAEKATTTNNASLRPAAGTAGRGRVAGVPAGSTSHAEAQQARLQQRAWQRSVSEQSLGLWSPAATPVAAPPGGESSSCDGSGGFANGCALALLCALPRRATHLPCARSSLTAGRRLSRPQLWRCSPGYD